MAREYFRLDRFPCKHHGSHCLFRPGNGRPGHRGRMGQGSVWFKVPSSVKINLNSNRTSDVSAKDIVLNLLGIFGANTLLGIRLNSTGRRLRTRPCRKDYNFINGTEMGAILIIFPYNDRPACRTKKSYREGLPDGNSGC